MRQPIKTRKSPSEKIVKDIKVATRNNIFLKRRSGSSWTGCLARIASLNCAAERASLRAFNTNGLGTL